MKWWQKSFWVGMNILAIFATGQNMYDNMSWIPHLSEAWQIVTVFSMTLEVVFLGLCTALIMLACLRPEKKE